MNLVKIELEIAKQKMDNADFLKFCGSRSCRNCPIWEYRETKRLDISALCEEIWDNVQMKNNNRIKYR